jgi:hypothetical protein
MELFHEEDQQTLTAACFLWFFLDPENGADIFP